jgi:hypothetical protein
LQEEQEPYQVCRDHELALQAAVTADCHPRD